MYFFDILLNNLSKHHEITMCGAITILFISLSAYKTLNNVHSSRSIVKKIDSKKCSKKEKFFITRDI